MDSGISILAIDMIRSNIDNIFSWTVIIYVKVPDILQEGYKSSYLVVAMHMASHCRSCQGCQHKNNLYKLT
jgi:hypothetical protein